MTGVSYQSTHSAEAFSLEMSGQKSRTYKKLVDILSSGEKKTPCQQGKKRPMKSNRSHALTTDPLCRIRLIAIAPRAAITLEFLALLR